MPAEFDSHSVSVTYVRILADLVSARGLSVTSLLANTGIREQWLDSAEERVSATSLLLAISNALRLTGDPSLGLLFGHQLKVSAHGFLGYAAMSSDTLGSAIDLCVTYFRTRFGLLDLAYRIEGPEAVLEFEPVLPLGDTETFICDAVISAFAVMGMNLLGELPAEGRACLRIDRPAHHALLVSDASPPRIDYSARAHQLRIPVALLNRPLALSDAASRRLAEAECRKELERLLSQDSIISRVRDILAESGQRFPKLEVVAERCYMSARTFKRRLQQVGTSFQEILDDIRRSRAIDYLRHTGKPIDEIAALLGYNDPSNFGRAFKRWTGKTPSQFRHHHEMMLPSK